MPPDDTLAVVRCSSNQRIILKPNESLDIDCYTDKELQYQNTTALLHETDDTYLPDYVDITPGIVEYEYQKNKPLKVNISNLTSNTVSIPPRAVICELQPVKIDEDVFTHIENQNVKDVLNEVHIDENKKLNDDQRRQIDDLLKKHRDIFSTGDTDIGMCDNGILG